MHRHAGCQCVWSMLMLLEGTLHSMYSQRIVELWNSLPHSIIMAPTLNNCKNRLDKVWPHALFLYENKSLPVTMRMCTTNKPEYDQHNHERLIGTEGRRAEDNMHTAQLVGSSQPSWRGRANQRAMQYG